MKKLKVNKKVIITISTIFIIIILLLGGGVIYVVSIIHSPLPQIDGSLRATGLKDSVEVIRDSYGILHIYTKNMHDLFFAQGYV